MQGSALKQNGLKGCSVIVLNLLFFIFIFSIYFVTKWICQILS